MNLESAHSKPVQTGLTDVFSGTIPVKLTKQELLELSSLSPLRSLLHIAAEWILIVAAVHYCRLFWSPLIYLITVTFIGARQHALLILMHDGVHYRLFRNRRLNDWTAEIVLAWPNLISARAYRKNHFAHHSYLNTQQDPDWARRQGDASWVFPMHWSRLAMLIIRDASGVGAIFFLRLARTLLSKDTGVSTGFLIARYGFYAVVAATFIWFGAFQLLLAYWFVPLFTWLIVIFRIRSIAEHSAIESNDRAYSQTRSTQASLLEHVFIAPKNVNYHIEHHFYPSVPFYRLPALHRMLMSKPEFNRGVHVTNSYFGVLRECLGDTQSHPFRDTAEAGFATEANSNLA